MIAEEYPKTPHTLSRLNKSLCWILVAIMIIMFISYYVTTLLQLQLSKLSRETSKINNENVELQNNLDKLMSYNNVEELVRRSGMLDAARQVIDMDAKNKISASSKTKKNKNERNYYRWTLGF